MSIANASSQFVGILLLPVFTRYLTPEDFGIISMVSLIITILALIYNPGLMSATMRLFHTLKSVEDQKILIGSAHRFFLFVPIIPIIIGLIFGENIFSILFKDFNFYPYGLLALLIAFFIQPGRMWTTLMTLLYKVEKTAILTAISVILGLVSAVILIVVFEYGAMGRVLAMFIPAIFLYVISLKTISSYSENKWSYKSLKKQLAFGFPLIIGMWAYQGLSFFGKYFLETLSTLENVGLYSVGVMISNLPMFLVLGFKQLWAPVFYENMNDKNYKLLKKLVKYFTFIICLISLCLILYIKEIVLIFIDEEFFSVITIVGILILSTFFNGLLTISNSFLSYNNNFSKISLFGFISTLINLVLNIILIPKLNILGAAIALLSSYFIFYILGLISERNNVMLIQSKTTTFIPPFFLIMGLVMTMSLSELFILNEFSLLEIIIKSSYLIFFIIICFRINLIRMSDFNQILKKFTEK